MMTFEQIQYRGPDGRTGVVLLRDPVDGRLALHKENPVRQGKAMVAPRSDVIVGVEVDPDGVPERGEHASSVVVDASVVLARTPLRLDAEDGLVEVTQ